MSKFLCQYYFNHNKIWNPESQAFPTIFILSRLLKVLILKDRNTLFNMTLDNRPLRRRGHRQKILKYHFHGNAMSDFMMITKIFDREKRQRKKSAKHPTGGTVTVKKTIFNCINILQYNFFYCIFEHKKLVKFVQMFLIHFSHHCSFTFR